MNPTMSVIIPAYNLTEYIIEAVEFIKICQNTPQLCWGDEWPSLSPGGRGLG